MPAAVVLLSSTQGSSSRSSILVRTSGSDATNYPSAYHCYVYSLALGLLVCAGILHPLLLKCWSLLLSGVASSISAEVVAQQEKFKTYYTGEAEGTNEKAGAWMPNL